MSATDNYLRISPDDTAHLGGLRWSADGEAVETRDGATFAFRMQVAGFLNGFFAVRPPIHFAHVLHLLHLLGQGAAARPKEAEVLARLYRDLKRPLRNAGVLCGVLCMDQPAVPGDLDTRVVFTRLLAGPADSILTGDGTRRTVPPLTIEEFETSVLGRLRTMTLKDLAHWLRHGRCALEGEGDQLARAVLPPRQRTLAGVLGALAQRERLTGALPFLAQLVSALTLPPRRLVDRELPMGGYSDVATRGWPEQILPSQFALEQEEFVRRFAANELLYFRREEPQTRIREDLVVLLDQGVRTWGDVRLVLAAAVLALGKRADRHRVSFRLAGTSSGGRTLDPRTAPEQQVAELLEASDLTAHPGLALATVLEEGEPGVRDVVLLTHPRSLAEADVQSAARQTKPGTRLFALAVDGAGDSLFAEVRHGAPVPVNRFHIDLTRKPAPAPKEAAPTSLGPLGPWRGDVEPIGFPFRFGPSRRRPRVGRFLCDFDSEGSWVLTVSDNGILCACHTNGLERELLPRPFLNGKVLHAVEVILGVTGGFVIGGLVGDWLVAAHYDWKSRTCTARTLGQGGGLIGSRKWFYHSDLHSIAVGKGKWVFGLDLATGEKAALSAGVKRGSGRAWSACEITQGLDSPPSELPIVQITTHQAPPPGSPLCAPPPGSHLCFNYSRGAIAIPFLSPEWHVPRVDGRPALQGATLHQACLRGNTLGLSATGGPTGAGTVLWLIDAQRGAILREFPHERADWRFTLSSDARWLARQVAHHRVEVLDLAEGRTFSAPPRGRYHAHVSVVLGDRRLAIITDTHVHLLNWLDSFIQVGSIPERRGATLTTSRALIIGMMVPSKACILAVSSTLPNFARYDLSRFVAGVQVDLAVAVDGFGQVAVCTRTGKLVCMFFAFKDQVAAWMPDGTRFGPGSLTGGPPTPGAAEAIGRALIAAKDKGGTVP